MSHSKGGQRQIEKKSPRSLLGTWRQGLSGSVKIYYIDRKKDPIEPDILPYRRHKQTRICKIHKGKHKQDHFQQSGPNSRIRSVVCRCGKKIDFEYRCKVCGVWSSTFSFFEPCKVCAKDTKTSEELVDCASPTNEDDKS